MDRSHAIGEINKIWPASIKGPSRAQIEFLGRLADMLCDAYDLGWSDAEDDFRGETREDGDELVSQTGHVITGDDAEWVDPELR